MEFCEKCGKLLKPIRDEKGTFLVCLSCGKREKLTKSKSQEYKLTRKITHTPKEKLEVTEVKKLKTLSDEEREELEDSYKDLLENMEYD